MPTTTTAKPKAASRKKRTGARRSQTRKTTKQTEAQRAVQRPLWIAVGAVAIAAEAVQEFVEGALKRGEKLETRARAELKKRRNGTPKGATQHKAKAKAKKLVKRSSNIADRVLNALEIPSHRDIVNLEKKVDAIARKVA